MFKRLRGWFDSLKNQAVSVVVLVVVLTVATATVIGTHLGQAELENQARIQVMTVAGLVVGSIEDKLANRFETLSRVARNLTMSPESLRGRAQLILERQVALAELFDRLYFIGDEGLVLADYPEGTDTGAVGINVKDRHYFQETSLQVTTIISRSIVARDKQTPIIIISAPILDFKGDMMAILAGSIELGKGSFLGRLSRLKVGKSGYVVVTDEDGTVLAHPDSARINSQFLAQGASEPASSGLVDVVRLNQSRSGRPLLTAYAQLDQAPWTVMVALPQAEAFAPIARLRHGLLWVALGLIVVLGLFSLQFFRRLLAPLGVLSTQLMTRHRDHSDQPVQVRGGREIQQLAQTFNRLTKERKQAVDDLAEREVFYRSLSESAPIGIVHTDVLGRIEFTNPAFQAIVGRPAESIKGRHLMDGIYEDDRSQVMAAWRRVLAEGKIYQGQYRLFDSLANRIIWVRTMTRVIETENCTLGSISVIRDITRELQIERELESTRARAGRILGVLQDGVILTNRSGVIAFANQPARLLLQSDREVVGEKLFERISIHTDTGCLGLNDIVQYDHLDSLDAVLECPDGSRLDIEITMLRLDTAPMAEQFVFVLRDDTEKRRAEEKLSWEATHDSLTGLANRRAFNARLSDVMTASAPPRSVSALMLIDLDYFKPVNDSGGHLIGDELLRLLGRVLLEGVRQSDFAARLGGDEFAVILPGCSVERALVIAESLRAAIESVVVEASGQQHSVTASIGVTAVTAGDGDPKAAIERADEATYAAKADGRNRVVSL